MATACGPATNRLVDPADGKTRTKNDHFRDLLAVAKKRGLAPRCVVFDAWYSGKDNLKAIRDHGWTFLTQIRSNRRVNLDRHGNRPVSELPIAAGGTVVHLEGFGLVKVFRIVATNGHTEHWITNDLDLDEGTRLAYGEQAWGIEEFHRGLKQQCGVERAQVRHPDGQRNHIGCALRAFVRLEYNRLPRRQLVRGETPGGSGGGQGVPRQTPLPPPEYRHCVSPIIFRYRNFVNSSRCRI